MATVRKKVDARIRNVIENAVARNERGLILLVGDRGRDQIPNLHFILNKASVKRRSAVLWCYKHKLGFTSNRLNRAKKVKREIKQGIREADEQNAFEMFLGSTDITYTFYKDSHRVLGRTFGMCILQDFEALTPNLLARTVETVQGGGLVIMLLQTMTSLRQLYSLSMDIHSRYRGTHGEAVPRFNERFLLSLGSCRNCIVADDELNVLPLSRSLLEPAPAAGIPASEAATRADAVDPELKQLQEDLADSPPLDALVGCANTLDQAKALLTFCEAAASKTLRATVVLTAARGRGKSAALGFAIAGAISYGYSNVFVTAPTPENLGTLFEMLFKGFDALGYKEHQDYEIIQSSNPEFDKAIVRVNIFRDHRQTVQYIQPQDAAQLAQAELLVIDEAAAIPLPIVKRLLGPYLVFMSSTVNGYEGTGRALSLKLVQQLRQQSAQGGGANAAAGGRSLREIQLTTPIRYAAGDPVEAWLNDLLCLDCTASIPRIISGIPAPSQCELYRVNRDTLFSRHPASEAFLNRMMSLYVSSHYKNTPNDLQLMSDAPAQRLFVLLGPNAGGGQSLPDILCVIQVALEGQITRDHVQAQLARGVAPSGDLIPWTMHTQYQSREFPALSGARIVRIATHPELARMGYATRAMELLFKYYDGSIVPLEQPAADAGVSGLLKHGGVLVDEDGNRTGGGDEAGKEGKKGKKDKEKKKSKKSKKDSEDEDVVMEGSSAEDAGGEDLARGRGAKLPPLLSALDDHDPAIPEGPEVLNWVGVSFGLTQSLYNFWSRLGFRPVYLRQTTNDTTGENSCIMLRALTEGAAGQMLQDRQWMEFFVREFRRRFSVSLAQAFRQYETALGLSVLQPVEPKQEEAGAGAGDESKEAREEAAGAEPCKQAIASFEALSHHLSQFDLQQLEKYCNNMLDYHVIIHLVPAIAHLYFVRGFRPVVHLSYTQRAILLGLGLQGKTVTDLEKELGISSSQVLALFGKALRKIVGFMRQLEEKEVRHSIAGKAGALSGKKRKLPAGGPLDHKLDSGLAAEGHKIQAEYKQKQQEQAANLLGDLADLAEYAVDHLGDEEQWADQVRQGAGNDRPALSLQRPKSKGSSGGAAGADASGFQKNKKFKGSHSHKKHSGGKKKQ